MFNVKRGGRLVLEPMTDEPKVWPTREAAESYIRLSFWRDCVVVPA